MTTPGLEAIKMCQIGCQRPAAHGLETCCKTCIWSTGKHHGIHCEASWQAVMKKQEDEKATIDRFEDPEAFHECLTKGWVHLIKGSFLVHLQGEGGRLARQQDLVSKGAFWGAEEA